MREIKHTPGPWKWSGHELEQVAGEFKDVIHTEVSCGAYCYGGCVDMTVSEADARLIAAAPEMFEAIQALVDWCDKSGQGEALWCVQMARAALAKATGEAQ